MSLFTRARRHVDMNRVKELREEKIKEEKIADIQKKQENILAELKKIEIQESLRYSNWRRDLDNEKLIEGMTSGGLLQSHLPAMGDAALDTLPNTSISDADNLDPYADYGDPDYAISAQDQNLGTVDASKYDTLKLTISGAFNSRSVDGTTLNDKIWIGVLINGTYAGNYLAQELGAGTHVIPIPARFQKPNMRFGAIKMTAIQGVSTPTSVTNIQFQRRTPKTVFVGLDDPEANAFIRGGLGGSEERKQKLKEQLEAGNELMIKMGLEPSKTSPGDIELAGIYQSPDGTYYSRPDYPKPDTSKWPSINDKPKPVKWPTPGVFRGQFPRV